MSFPRFALSLITVAVLSLSVSSLENKPVVDNDFVQQQFGSNCSLIGMPPATADFDGDGVEDIVIPAQCIKPMIDQGDNNYEVLDPYDAFFGYGNPKITTQFANMEPTRHGYALLIIHGAGPEAWHSATPKAKFMIVNLPYKTIYVKKMMVRKKAHMAIYADETGGDAMTSVIFWDGKKYKYQPLGSNMEQ